MTTFQVTEDQELADGLTAAIALAGPDAVTALGELRSAAQPGNGYHVAHVGGAGEPVARAIRAAAAAGHPAAGKLEDLAAGLEQQAAMRRANGA